MGYESISREILAEAGGYYGASEDDLCRALTEKQRIIRDMGVERIHYLAYIRAYLLKAVERGNFVYHGHAGHLLLKDVPHVLKVRVVAGMDFRIRAAMANNNLNRDEAMAYIGKMDDERARWTRFLYGVDWRDPALYDLVVNLDHMSISSACELVCRAVRLDEFKETPEWEKAKHDLAFGAEVRAMIALDRSVGASDKGIEVEANDGMITIKGKVSSLSDAEKIRHVPLGLPGVRDVVMKVEY